MEVSELGKQEKVREAREAKDSEGKSREASGADRVSDLYLDIAEKLFSRKPYNLIAKMLKVSPATISKVARMMEKGIIQIGKDGKALDTRNTRQTEIGPLIGPLPPELQQGVLGAAHLEGKAPLGVLADLVRLDRKMRLKGLDLKQLGQASKFLEKAHSRRWTTDRLLAAMTRLENLRLSDLDPQLIGLLRDFLAYARTHNLKPEQIVKISQKTETDWKKHIQEAYNMGVKQGAENLESWLNELIPKAFDDIYTQSLLSKVIVIAKEAVMSDLARDTSQSYRRSVWLDS
jgi:hypothetical protein